MPQKKLQKTQIRNLKDIRYRKKLIAKRLKLRSKLIEIHLKKFEQQLTIPNIAKELFRNSKYEFIAPIVAKFVSDKIKQLSFWGAITGFITGLGSTLFSLKDKFSAKRKIKFRSPRTYKEDEMFI